jgi:RNA polymerase primary sigma factor
VGDTAPLFQAADETIRLPADPSTLCQDSIRFYYYEIGRYDLLSPEEVAGLAQRIERGRKGRRRRGLQVTEEPEECRQAKHLLISANLRLVLYNAKKYQGLGVDLMDLVQEGNLGLMHAVEKFDASLGYRFSTYATWWIRQYVVRAIANQARTIRLPVHQVETIGRLSRVRARLYQELGREPLVEEMAQQMGTSGEKIRELLKASQHPLSLHTLLGEENDNELGDVLEDQRLSSPTEITAQHQLQESVAEALHGLSEREREVLQWRYGLLDGTSHTLREVGELLHVSHQRVRQIEVKALQKLRLKSSDQLKDFLN